MPISIFGAGSLARQEVGNKSDLDLFVTADSDSVVASRLQRYRLFAELIQVNKQLGLPEFSNDGRYLKVYPLSRLRELTGAPEDDSDNFFTTRMLMILESCPLLNAAMYEIHLKAVIENYYRDNVGKRSFRPLFLLNDLWA